MSSDTLQIDLTNCVYDNKRWLPPLTSSNQDATQALKDFKSVLDAVPGLTYSSAKLKSTDTSNTNDMNFTVVNPIYGGNKYLSFLDATTLRNVIISEIANVSQRISQHLNTYDDVVVRSYRSDQSPSSSYTPYTGTSEGLEIFVSGIIYSTKSYLEPTEVDAALLDFNTTLDGISDLEFGGLRLSSVKDSNIAEMFIGIENATYLGKKYLTLLEAVAIRNAILNSLASMSNVDDSNVDVHIIVAKGDGQPSSNF